MHVKFKFSLLQLFSILRSTLLWNLIPYPRSCMRSLWFMQLHLWTSSLFQHLYFVPFLPFPFFYPPFSHQQKQTTLFLLLIITFSPWDPMSTRKGHSFGSKFMAPPKILFTLSLLLMGKCWADSPEAEQSCSAVAKTLVCHQHLPSSQCTALWELLWGNSLCLQQTLNTQKYSGCLLTALTGWRREECYYTKLWQLRKAETKLLKYSQNVWQKNEGCFIPDYITVHFIASYIHLRDYILMT